MSEIDTIPVSNSHDKVSVQQGYSVADFVYNRKRGNGKLAKIALCLFMVVVVLCIVLPQTMTPSEKSVDSLVSTECGEEIVAPENGIDIYDYNAEKLNTSSEVDVAVVEDLFVGIDTDLPYFSSEITNGYENIEDFDAAMTKAALLMVKKTAERKQMPPQSVNMESAMFKEEMAMAADSAGGGVTDFGTNNQEIGVDEADVIKADENYVYAAYGDYIIVWDADGIKVSQVAMPPLPRVYYDDTNWQENEAERPSYQPKATIQALMLNSGVLTVIVSGYGNILRESISSEPSVLYDYLNTHIRTYNTLDLPTTGELEFIGMKNVNGRYLDARAIGSSIHLATVSGIDTYRGLTSHFDGNTKESFLNLQNEIIPNFIGRLREELFSGSGEVAKMLKINLWQTDSPESEELGNLLVDEDFASNAAWVTSFDVTNTATPNANIGEERELSVSTSMFMSPSSWMHMYGTEDKLILATQGWNWNAEVAGEQQTTYLLSLSADGPTTDFISVGTVTGHLLNQYSLDIAGNDLRVATTVTTRRINIPRPMPMAAETTMVVEEEQAVPGETEMEAEMAPSSIVAKTGVGAALNQRIEPDSIEVDGMMAMPGPPINDAPVNSGDGSSTENYVIVLELEREDKPGQIVERGRVKIGEIHESITAVRFFDDFAYVVTFEKTDPFYVIDLQIPSKLGEFKLNGFSSYLHPMNSNNTLLIGIGQDATDEGRTTGLMITVFDATNPEAPTALVNYTLSDTRSGFSSSSVQWDHKAFRYINGHLLIPLHEWKYIINEKTGEVEQHSFEGFSVFTVSTSAIKNKFRVSMFDRQCHYCSGYLPQRSFVYNGDLMTVQNNNIKSTNLVSGLQQWNMDIVIDGEDATCCPYYI